MSKSRCRFLFSFVYFLTTWPRAPAISGASATRTYRSRDDGHAVVQGPAQERLGRSALALLGHRLHLGMECDTFCNCTSGMWPRRATISRKVSCWSGRRRRRRLIDGERFIKRISSNCFRRPEFGLLATARLPTYLRLPTTWVLHQGTAWRTEPNAYCPRPVYWDEPANRLHHRSPHVMTLMTGLCEVMRMEWVCV